MDLSLRDLRYFEMAAETEHLARAAESVARSQPALTKAIRRLEAAVDAPLFERAGRGVKLTPVGQVLLQEARRLRASAEQALRHVTDFSQGAAGLVRIGSGTVTVSGVLPRVCSLLLAEAPAAQVQIEVGPTMELLERLRERKVDIVLGLLPPGADPELVCQPIVTEDVVIAARRGHPVFREGRITFEALLAHRWVLPTVAAPSRQWLDALFATRGLPRPQVQIEANSIPLLPQLIAGTDLLSFVSRHAIGRERPARLREVPLAAAVLRRPLGVSYRSGGYLSPVAQRLIALLRQEADAVVPADYQ